MWNKLNASGQGLPRPGRLPAMLVGYSVCSSTLLIANKVVLRNAKSPALLLFCQCAFTAASVPIQSICCSSITITLITPVELRRFSVVVATFTGTLFANAKGLQHVNVDFLIGLRLTIPLFTSFLEAFFLGREPPQGRSLVSLMGIACSFFISLHFDFRSQLSLESAFWLALWYFWTIFEGIYVKHVVGVSKLSTLNQTFYQNLLSLPILLTFAYANNELQLTWRRASGAYPIFILAISCILGYGMSFFSFLLRKEISATSFSMVGNLCKIITIAVNSIIWSLHSSTTGTASIVACIVFSTMYTQAPMRDSPKVLDDEESTQRTKRKEQQMS